MSCKELTKINVKTKDIMALFNNTTTVYADNDDDNDGDDIQILLIMYMTVWLYDCMTVWLYECMQRIWSGEYIE